ncbi:RagB/SusD family nutrient uptake outer membrane protein [Telluribacter sp. SYSU D00476]|uniref:RagB/SusD family nutrient uptake outer membrane protein n=1 Tax=Telluribacter sp. SYSU D00476 TaxID=2811430 RepID=UPI001FF65C58|nr:RagB/SusD family nutrient uptake outer membrane protein [Telluribacter sp. SYSU D00476]
MKKFATICLLSTSLLTLSCKDLLEEVPTALLSRSQFYKTAADANSAVNAISATYHTNNMYILRYGVFTTALEDYASGQGQYIPLSQYQVTTSIMGTTDGFWAGFYKTIDAANLALKYIPTITMDEKQKDQLLSEAHFYRAHAYYNLVRMFGALPIRTEPTEDLSAVGGKREPVDKVYAQIIEDLKKAEAGLPLTQTLAGRPTLGAAKTMLADVYLVREQWTDARDKAEEVIKSGAYSLVNVSQSSDFEKIFGAGVTSSSEEVFSIKFQRTVAGGSFLPQFYHLPTSQWATSGFGTFFGFPTYPLLRDWSAADLRKGFNLYTAGPNKQGVIVQNGANQPIRFGKFKETGAPSSGAHGVDYPVYRYADALLIYAEAASQADKGPTALALERLNMVHRRAYGYAPSSPSPVDFTLEGQTAASFRDLVLKERAYEFLVEGKRWHDLVRTGTAKQVIKAAKGIDIPNSVLLMPIPKQEIDNNPDIEPNDQNPGY